MFLGCHVAKQSGKKINVARNAAHPAEIRRAAHSCLLPSPGGSCIMYAPAETDYNDANGTYVFEQVCLLT